MFGIWDVYHVRRSGCGMFRMWNVGMLNIWNERCWEFGMLGDVRDVRFVWNVGDVRFSRC